MLHIKKFRLNQGVRGERNGKGEREREGGREWETAPPAAHRRLSSCPNSHPFRFIVSRQVLRRNDDGDALNSRRARARDGRDDGGALGRSGGREGGAGLHG